MKPSERYATQKTEITPSGKTVTKVTGGEDQHPIYAVCSCHNDMRLIEYWYGGKVPLCHQGVKEHLN